MDTGIKFVLPEIIISVMACFILIIDLFLDKGKKYIIYYMTQFTLLLVVCSLFYLFNESRHSLFSGAFVFDFFSVFTKLVIILVAFVIFLYSKDYLLCIDLYRGEYFVLCLLSILGMMIMISSGTFLTLYLGLELLELPIYSLSIMNKNILSSEASMKYFVMGSVASGIFLFGVSLIYGVTGTIELTLINKVIIEEEVFSNITLQYGLVFIIVGLIFKFGAVPFHMWVHDVYQGSSVPVTLFISTIPKIASLGMAYRLLVDSFVSVNSEIEFLFIIVGIASLFIGNIFAIVQENIKRLLAYSAISHVGFMFFGFLVPDFNDLSAVIFYIVTYVVTVLGVFGIIIFLSTSFKEAELVSDFSGLGFKEPLLALTMVLFLLSLAGVPPTVGFYAKFFILKNLISYGYLELAIFAVLMSVVGVYYYLKVIKVMFFEGTGNKVFNLKYVSFFGLVILYFNGFFVLFLGSFPGLLLKYCVI